MVTVVDPPDLDPAPAQPLDPVRERERILALVRGRILNAYEAEMVCTTLTLLAEMEPGLPIGSAPTT